MVVRRDSTLIVADAEGVCVSTGRGRATCRLYESPHVGDHLLLALDPHENLYVLNADACWVSVFDREGEPLFSFGSKGGEEYQFFSPSAIAVDSTFHLYICDRGTLKVFEVVYLGGRAHAEAPSPGVSEAHRKGEEEQQETSPVDRPTSQAPDADATAPPADEALPGG
jgi:hypothetical protein